MMEVNGGDLNDLTTRIMKMNNIMFQSKNITSTVASHLGIFLSLKALWEGLQGKSKGEIGKLFLLEELTARESVKLKNYLKEHFRGDSNTAQVSLKLNCSILVSSRFELMKSSKRDYSKGTTRRFEIWTLEISIL